MGRNVYLASSIEYCKSNAVLSARCLRYFTANGWGVTKRLGDADLVVINTCGFHERVQLLTKGDIAAALAEAKPGAKVVSIGCLNKINRETLADFPSLVVAGDPSALDAVIGAAVPFSDIADASFDETLFTRLGRPGNGYNYYRRKIVEAAASMCRGMRRWPYPFLESSQMLRVLEELDYVIGRQKTYVQIGTGCVGTCSYCVIKRARGPAVSRPAAEIVEELKRVYKPGRIINLVADDCGSWGADLGKTVFDLVGEIRRAFPEAPLDFCYINPYWFERYPREYVEMCRTTRINSLNVSLQSGSDRIIAAMNRRYKVANVLRVMDEIRAVSPSTMLWGHLMIHHPGETLGDLLKTVRAAARFNYYMLFDYSPLRTDGPPHAPPPLAARFLKWTLVFSTQYVMMFLRLFFVPPAKPRVEGTPASR